MKVQFNLIYLDLIRIGQVVRGDTEPSTSNLLDGGAAIIREPLRVFTALPIRGKLKYYKILRILREKRCVSPCV